MDEIKLDRFRNLATDEKTASFVDSYLEISRDYPSEMLDKNGNHALMPHFLSAMNIIFL